MGSIQGKIRAGVTRTVQLDKCSHGLLSVLPSQHAIHEGKHFQVVYSVASVGALTTPDDMMTLSFTTPAADLCLFLSINISGSAGALAKLIEGKTGGGASPTGTIQTYNNNRGNTDVSTLTDVAGVNTGKVSYDATAFTGGTELHSEYLTGAQRASNKWAADVEWVLAPSTLYQVSLYNNAANPATIVLSWCECEAKG